MQNSSTIDGLISFILKPRDNNCPISLWVAERIAERRLLNDDGIEMSEDIWLELLLAYVTNEEKQILQVPAREQRAAFGDGAGYDVLSLPRSLSRFDLAPFANSNRVIAMTPLFCAWLLCTDWSRPRKPLRSLRPERGPSWNRTPRISKELRPVLSLKQKRNLTRKNLSPSKQASWIRPCTSLSPRRVCEGAFGTPSLPDITHGAAVLTSAWHVLN